VVGQLVAKVGPAVGEVGWVFPPAPATAVFAARKTIAQSMTLNTYNVLTFDALLIQTGGTFDGSRFTASVPGLYLVVAAVTPNTYSASVTLALRQNGYSIHWGNGKNGTQDSSLLAACVITLNGATDYVEAVLLTDNAQPLIYRWETPHQFFGFKVA
jgi:hypothetical protein